MCCSWRKPKNQPAWVTQLRTRSILLSLPPWLIFAAFSMAGLFVTRIAGGVNQSNDVKVAHNRCVFWSYDSADGFDAGQAKVSNDTLAGRAYSRSCYGTNATLVECGVYPVQSLPIITSRVPCPSAATQQVMISVASETMRPSSLTPDSWTPTLILVSMHRRRTGFLSGK